MDSQQLAEYISLCDEFIISQSPSREDQQNHKEKKRKTRLSDHYACLGAEEFGSQDSFIAWGGHKIGSEEQGD
nr:NAC domain-containing protein 8 [Ipomoea batatas]